MHTRNRKQPLPLRLTVATLAIATFLSLVDAPDAVGGETPKKSPSPEVSARWSSKMQQLYQNLAQLLTDVSSKARFEDPAILSLIYGAARKLADLSHYFVMWVLGAPYWDQRVAIIG
jgi:hypothetical protein